MELLSASVEAARPRFDESEEMVDALEYLMVALPRQVGDLLKITHIPGTHAFRANWYGSRLASTSAVAGLRKACIRESAFLHCHLEPDGTPRITYAARQ